MKKTKFTFEKILKEVVEISLKGNANSTTCVYVYQPTAPKQLKHYKVNKNDNKIG